MAATRRPRTRKPPAKAQAAARGAKASQKPKPKRKRRSTPKAKPKVTVVAALEAELAAMRKTSKDVADSALAASALVLARELDKPKNSATSKSLCSRALSDAMDQLRAQLPPDEERDQLDDLSARRADRRAAGRATS